MPRSEPVKPPIRVCTSHIPETGISALECSRSLLVSVERLDGELVDCPDHAPQWNGEDWIVGRAPAEADWTPAEFDQGREVGRGSGRMEDMDIWLDALASLIVESPIGLMLDVLAALVGLSVVADIEVLSDPGLVVLEILVVIDETVVLVEVSTLGESVVLVVDERVVVDTVEVVVGDGCIALLPEARFHCTIIAPPAGPFVLTMMSDISTKPDSPGLPTCNTGTGFETSWKYGPVARMTGYGSPTILEPGGM